MVTYATVRGASFTGSYHTTPTQRFIEHGFYLTFMTKFRPGDRVRVDNCSDHHGRHAIIQTKWNTGETVGVVFDDGTEAEFSASELRPVPNVRLELTEREHDTVTNIWGENTPDNLRMMDTESLWNMEERTAEAVRKSYRDDDMDALGILLGLELKITQVISERMDDTFS